MQQKGLRTACVPQQTTFGPDDTVESGEFVLGPTAPLARKVGRSSVRRRP